MNRKFCKINEIIDICDEMILKIKTEGKISATDSIYRNYKRKIDNFMSSNNLVHNDYAPCKVLESFFFDETPRYSVNLSEANMIRKTIIDVKHQLYKDDYEEISEEYVNSVIKNKLNSTINVFESGPRKILK